MRQQNRKTTVLSILIGYSFPETEMCRFIVETDKHKVRMVQVYLTPF